MEGPMGYRFYSFPGAFDRSQRRARIFTYKVERDKVWLDCFRLQSDAGTNQRPRKVLVVGLQECQGVKWHPKSRDA